MTKREPENQLRSGTEEHVQEDDGGSWQRADDQTLAGRKILKGRRRHGDGESVPSPVPAVAPAVGLFPNFAPEGAKPEAAPVASTAAPLAAAAPTTESKPDTAPAESPAKPAASTPSKETPAPAAAPSPAPAAKDGTPVKENGAEAKENGSSPAEPPKKPFVFGTAGSSTATPFTFSTAPAFPQFSFPAFTFPAPTTTPGATGAPGSIFNTPPAPFSFPAFTPSKPANEDDEDDGAVENEEEEPQPDPENSAFPKIAVVTGEENEETVFSVRCKLFSSNPQIESGAWKERGVGLFKINIEKSEGTSAKRKIRLVMRMEGVKRLILNVALQEFMKIDRASDKQVRFNAIEKVGSTTMFLLRVTRKDEADDLFNALVKNKSNPTSTSSSSSSSSTTTTSSSSETKETATPEKSATPVKTAGEKDPNLGED